MKTNQEIVDETNELGRKFYSELGYEVIKGYRFDRAKHPTEKSIWRMACIAQEELTGTEAGAVPDERAIGIYDNESQMAYSEGWNACREEILNTIPTPPASAEPDEENPISYQQRFTEAVQIITGHTPPAELVDRWIRHDESDPYDLQHWIGSYGPWWCQNIGMLDAAQAMADAPIEGEPEIVSYEKPTPPASAEPTVGYEQLTDEECKKIRNTYWGLFDEMIRVAHKEGYLRGMPASAEGLDKERFVAAIKTELKEGHQSEWWTGYRAALQGILEEIESGDFNKHRIVCRACVAVPADNSEPQLRERIAELELAAKDLMEVLPIDRFWFAAAQLREFKKILNK